MTLKYVKTGSTVYRIELNDIEIEGIVRAYIASHCPIDDVRIDIEFDTGESGLRGATGTILCRDPDEGEGVWHRD